MRLTLLFTVFVFGIIAFNFSAKSQTPGTSPKVKVILLGTFHFGETSDRNRTSFPDLFSTSRQEQLDQLASKLAASNPDKIFVEAEPGRQGRIDSLYEQYRHHRLKDSSWLRNEIVQIGFRTGVKLNGKAKIICADHRQELPYNAMQQYEKAHQKDSNPPFFDSPYPFTNKKSSLSKSDMRKYLLSLNDSEARQRSMYDYLHYALLYGNGQDYTGADFTTAWYGRNLKIMTNIFRALDANDRCILVVMGSGHTAILHELLAGHPRIEVVDLASVL